VSRRKEIENGSVFSVRQAAAACNVSSPGAEVALAGAASAPPWTAEQLRRIRDVTDPHRHRLGSSAAHGTMARWNAGCSCGKAQERLPPEVRQRLLDAIYAGKPFRRTLGDLGLTSNQVWGLTKTDTNWLAALDAALAATRRHDLRHGTNAAYVAGCVCKECREHQRVRMLGIVNTRCLYTELRHRVRTGHERIRQR
jgi:hypothetical protein